MSPAHVKAARWFLRDALARCERLDDQHGIARCLNLLGYLAWGDGDLSTSRDLHLQSLPLNRELSDRWATAWALHRLSVTLLHLADQDQTEASSVRPLIEEGLTIWQELGERRHPLADSRPELAPAPFQQRFERHLVLARSVHGAEVVASAWAEGQAMALAEAIAYAQRACASAAAGRTS